MTTLKRIESLMVGGRISDLSDVRPLINVEDLSVSLGIAGRQIDIVRGIDFKVARGGSLGIIGESGSGKSIAVRALMGLVSASSSRIDARRLELDGQNLLGLSQRELVDIRGRKMALIFQDSISSLNPLLTVGYQLCEILTSKAGMGRRDARKKAVALLGSVGIPDAASRLDAFPHEFSGGMRQRVMIAIALALEPQMLIADEPTTALDVTIQAQIIDLLNDLRASNGMGLILITHDLAVASELVEDVAVMYAGRIVESGPLEQVFSNPKHPYTQALLRSMPTMNSRSKMLETIPGTPPSPMSVPSGCAFHPRCAFSQDICLVGIPPVTQINSVRTTACIRWEELYA